MEEILLNCEANVCANNVLCKDGETAVPTSSHDHAAPVQPVKKQTRQWAAWTRQEEESFFTALRQVGKNFEKITCRVQSKNKDQVRHYYYRLVRRMNKLLGPELCLDAKNSKDTNAAMLRWWSLLQNYSCRASKLHLKPRRFKMFVETLENLLLKDRKKNIRRRLSPGENSSTTTNAVPNQGRASGDDSCSGRMVLVDGQNIQKVGTGKGSSLKRSNGRLESSSLKSARPRRKTAAYKRWEKAAIAGVSLVADAAEHLERATTERDIDHVQGTDVELSVHDGLQNVGKELLAPQRPSRSFPSENNIQNSGKLKLQLFPIDVDTQRALEKGDHNPFLELTLSSRKRISSVMDHLSRKWGNSNLSVGDLMLFPNWVQRQNFSGSQNWTKDSTVCVADVYKVVGSPEVFRLRYGWFSKGELGSVSSQALRSSSTIGEHNLNKYTANMETICTLGPVTFNESQNPGDHHKDQLVSATKITATTLPSTVVRNETVGSVRSINTKNMGDAPPMLLHQMEEGARCIASEVEKMDETKKQKDMALSAGEWADSLTNISVGDLLAEATDDMDAKCAELPVSGSSNCLHQTSFSCDSFDAAIAAHIYKHQNKVDSQPALASHTSSIWDAEETCDAFAFQKNGVFFEKAHTASQDASPDTFKQTIADPVLASNDKIEELRETQDLDNEDPTLEDPMDECQSEGKCTKDFGALADMYWPDSLGPLDLDMPSCRYHGEDLILNDSLGGLSRLIANSLDAFQNCSLFGLDKKEPAPIVESRQTTSFSDYKIGNEV